MLQATDTIVVRGPAEIDLLNAPEVRSEIAAAIWAHPAMVIIDFSRVEFLDSACVHALDMSAAQAGRAGVRLALVRPRGAAARVLEVCGI